MYIAERQEIHDQIKQKLTKTKIPKFLEYHVR